MTFRYIPPLKNYHSYPIIMKDGTIQELYHVNERFFSSKGQDVSQKVSYRIIYEPYSFGCI